MEPEQGSDARQKQWLLQGMAGAYQDYLTSADQAIPD